MRAENQPRPHSVRMRTMDTCCMLDQRVNRARCLETVLRVQRPYDQQVLVHGGSLRCSQTILMEMCFVLTSPMYGFAKVSC